MPSLAEHAERIAGKVSRVIFPQHGSIDFRKRALFERYYDQWEPVFTWVTSLDDEIHAAKLDEVINRIGKWYEAQIGNYTVTKSISYPGDNGKHFSLNDITFGVKDRKSFSASLEGLEKQLPNPTTLVSSIRRGTAWYVTEFKGFSADQGICEASIAFSRRSDGLLSGVLMFCDEKKSNPVDALAFKIPLTDRDSGLDDFIKARFGE